MREIESFFCDHHLTQAGLDQLDYIVENRPVELTPDEASRLPSIILAFTAEEFGIFEKDILGKRRSDEEMAARRAACEVFRTLTTLDTDQMSLLVGGSAEAYLSDSRRLLTENKYYLACVLHISNKTLIELGYSNRSDATGSWFVEAV